MPVFRIHRMKENPRQQFRIAPHASATAEVKSKDFEPAGEVEAAGVYDAWTQLKDTDAPLQIGDVLEREDGTLMICKYVGFEPARWFVPEVKPPVPEAPVPDPATPLQTV
jgi:hypothetical protein